MAPTPHNTADAPPAPVAAATAPALPDKTITIRSYKPQDHAAVVELFSSGMLSYAHSGKHSEALVKQWEEYVAQSVTEDLADIVGVYLTPGGHFWVATCVEENGEEVVVGMVGLEAKPEKAYELRRMSVHSGYRRYGVGKKLVAHLEQWAKDQGLAKVWLSTGGPMVQAQKFYLSIGYTQTKVEVITEDPYFEVVYFEKVISSQHVDQQQRLEAPLPEKTITIRTFKPADLPAVVELFSAGMLYYAHSGNHSEAIKKIWVDYVAQSITEDLADVEGTYFASGGHFWVATCVEDNGEEVVVGMVGLEGKPEKAYELRRMSVRAEYRRYGVGKKLVTHLEQWAKDQGLAKVWLSTGGPMVQAQKFYHSIGYTQTKTEIYSEEPLFEVVYFEKVLA